MSHVPKGWLSASLSAICSKIVDGSHNPPKASEHGLPMLSARNIKNNQINFDDFRFISEEDFAFEHKRTNVEIGDVLLTIVGTIGRTAVVPDNTKPFALQRSVAVLKPMLVNPKYVSFALETPALQKFLQENSKGTAQKGIYLATLGQVEIPLAPLNEQTRIVEKLEELLSDLDAGVTELNTAQKKLTQYQQALLKTAVVGGLTTVWRAKNANRATPIESGAQLLDRILTKRRHLCPVAVLNG